MQPDDSLSGMDFQTPRTERELDKIIKFCATNGVKGEEGNGTGDGKGVIEDVPGDDRGQAQQSDELPALIAERCIHGCPLGEAA